MPDHAGEGRRPWSGRLPRRVAVVLLAAVSLAGVACGGDDDSTEAGGATTGKALYEQSCALCHGKDLRGTGMGPSHLSKVYEPSHHSDASFVAAIRQGSRQHHWDFGDMPPVEGLDDDEIEAIIAYVREQQAEQGFEPYPPS